MDERDLSLRRGQMGRTTKPWTDHAGPDAVWEFREGSWLFLTGSPSPAVNLALVHDGEPATLAHTRARVEQAGFPTVLMLAGPSEGADLGDGWAPSASMPFMASRLSDRHVGADPRVRIAGAADRDVARDLMGDAFELEPEIADVCSRVADMDVGSTRVWLLVEEGQAVSGVITAIADDAVCVWCMATPKRFARRGYGRALLAHVLLAAREEGARIGLLAATPAGRPLYEATGWQTLEEWQMFERAGSAHSSA
jgi:GNAT superfamily N-acetyltransferase